MKYTIQHIDEPKQDLLNLIYKGLDKHAVSIMGYSSFEQSGFIIHDENKKTIAALVGILMYGVFYIKLLWVDEKHRKCGLGSQLMAAAEAHAKKNNCTYITVDTFSWQGVEFYQKLGFKNEFIYDGYDNDSQFYFFRKKLIYP